MELGFVCDQEGWKTAAWSVVTASLSRPMSTAAKPVRVIETNSPLFGIAELVAASTRLGTQPINEVGWRNSLRRFNSDQGVLKVRRKIDVSREGAQNVVQRRGVACRWRSARDRAPADALPGIRNTFCEKIFNCVDVVEALEAFASEQILGLVLEVAEKVGKPRIGRSSQRSAFE